MYKSSSIYTAWNIDFSSMVGWHKMGASEKKKKENIFHLNVVDKQFEGLSFFLILKKMSLKI